MARWAAARTPNVPIDVGSSLGGIANRSSWIAWIRTPPSPTPGVVTAPLGSDGSLGVLGVIGPRHLDYNRVVPLVDLTAEVVRRTLQGS